MPVTGLVMNVANRDSGIDRPEILRWPGALAGLGPMRPHGINVRSSVVEPAQFAELARRRLGPIAARLAVLSARPFAVRASVCTRRPNRSRRRACIIRRMSSLDDE